MRSPLFTSLPPDFSARWDGWYEDAPPLAFLMRPAYPERWLRIYSLPQGKRYPTGGFEYAELLRRHKAVAREVIGEGWACALLLLEVCRIMPNDLSVAAGLQTELQRLELPPELWEDDEGCFVEPMCLFGVGVVWNGDSFHGFMNAVADDKIEGLVVQLDSGRVYAPYDGGADLFFADAEERDAARVRFAEWISPREDGH